MICHQSVVPIFLYLFPAHTGQPKKAGTQQQYGGGLGSGGAALDDIILTGLAPVKGDFISGEKIGAGDVQYKPDKIVVYAPGG